MNITITDKRIRIEQDGISSTHALGTLRYYYPEERDSITVKGDGFLATSPIEQVMVNGERMTDGNIEDLMDLMFVLSDAAPDLVRERRIGLVMERTEQLVPVGENMVLYKNNCKNVSKLDIKVNDGVSDWIPVDVNAGNNVKLSGEYDVYIRIERATTDAVSTVYLFTQTI